MRENYLLPVLQRKLELEWKYVSKRILGNPRITEVNHITTQYVKGMGNLFMYEPFSTIYEMKFNSMMDYFLQDSTYIETDRYGTMQVNLPEYRDGEHDITKKEFLKYKAEEAGISRIRKRVQTEKDYEKERLEELSSYDVFGIEKQREVEEEKEDKKRRVRYVRLDGKPHIIQVINLNTGEEKYIDIRNSEHIEDLDLSNAIQIEKEKIADLTQIEKIRIAERTSKSVYGEGIRTMLGMQINLEQANHGEK